MATLDDIARQLGVAKSTVSKALNGADDVSENMRRLVLEKAVELGYSRALRGAAPRIAVFGSPVAMSSAIMAREMKNDEQLAVQLLVWTSLVSALTIFLTACVMMTAGLLGS